MDIDNFSTLNGINNERSFPHSTSNVLGKRAKFLIEEESKEDNGNSSITGLKLNE